VAGFSFGSGFGFGDRKRRREIESLADGPLKRFYDNTAAALNDPTQPWHTARYLALDLETTGLNPERDHMLSAGWICVDHGAVVASSARHHLVRPPDGSEVGASATIHGITDDEAASGAELGPVVEALLADLEGRVLVCHFAQMELGFVGRACRQLWGADFRPPQLIDTMQWYYDRANRIGAMQQPDDLRLYSLLRQYNLPSIRPHHALSDAYGTALLLLATARSTAEDRRLSELLDRRSW
jgi:DNA polymerase-3 subunit epsilon